MSVFSKIFLALQIGKFPSVQRKQSFAGSLEGDYS